MGCEIVAFIEYEHNGTVEHLGQVYIHRNYHLFHLIAGVRGTGVQNECLPVAEKKGLPDKIHWRLEEKAYPAQYVNRDHAPDPTSSSHTWLNLEEVEEVINQYSTLKVPHYISLKENENTPDGYSLDVDRWMNQRLAYNQVPATCPPELFAVRGAMKELKDAGCKPKLVVWFSNE
jgi:hypothetical protein